MTNYHQAGKVKFKPTPSKEALQDRFGYDPDIGSLVMKSTGKPSRTWHSNGKKSGWRTCIEGEMFSHSRLIWAWHYGDPCSLQIDHIDGNRRNDRIENLRTATNSQNNANKKHFKGYRLTRTGKFHVDVMKDGKHHRGGTYAKEEDAIRVANALRKALHGEFAVTQKPLAKSQSSRSVHVQQTFFLQEAP